jgi:hypothetical protein
MDGRTHLTPLAPGCAALRYLSYARAKGEPLTANPMLTGGAEVVEAVLVPCFSEKLLGDMVRARVAEFNQRLAEPVDPECVIEGPPSGPSPPPAGQ